MYVNMCVCVYSRVHLTNVLLTGLCLFIFHLESKVFFPFQLHPAVFFIPQKFYIQHRLFRNLAAIS